MSQLFIGIDRNTSLLYEGTASMYGHAILPTPFLSIGCHIGPLAEWDRSSSPRSLDSTQMLFREDYFDPVARVRRGRLYYRFDGLNPARWHVQRHPAFGTHPRSDASYSTYGESAIGLDGYSPKELVTFCAWIPSESVLKHLRDSVLVLGVDDRASIHTVLDIERLASNEELITMRTRASLGVLPELLEALIPERYAALVLEQYEKAARAAFRDDADSVVDRCREAASAALNAERSLHDDAAMGKDLGELANFFAADRFGTRGGRVVLSNAARIIARLHARTKTAERLNNQTAPLSEGDAECALALLGTIYRELEWTYR